MPDGELALFAQVCRQTGLNPFTKQIYAVKRWDSAKRQETTAFQVGIDGARLIAERTGKYAGQLGPFWCGPDAEWVDVWLSPEPARGCTGWRHPERLCRAALGGGAV